MVLALLSAVEAVFRGGLLVVWKLVVSAELATCFQQ